ncbi:MAG: tRNA uridine-5-carboxymethylaminomethyl(34) synthesis GTPase MnmE [Proteobacteria bacterium SW_6_67_9]|nr:MAG: tRNA uridine-5-carboxymethylaminomethyl(34) synthesis GTPase MnmE [Proteobacteria bacterium SW_6_67_9]
MAGAPVSDTIAAPATPPGHGGIGVVRISGPDAGPIGSVLAPPLPQARTAAFRRFCAADNTTLDQGLVLWLPGPGSYTGEDTLELQGHGSPVVIDALLGRALELGARSARPGELSERAFLNGRIDLAQAEAVADLIESADRAGARAAMRSLEGAFSERVGRLVDELTELRAWIEAAFDFPEDDLDLLADGQLRARLSALRARLRETRDAAAQGRRLVTGARVVLAGAANAGKSSLLNRLAGVDAAIVTDIAGTTRDTLSQSIRLAGLPVDVTDTAGLRATTDPVESAGVERAYRALEGADRILLVVDAQADTAEALADLPRGVAVDVIRSKIDLTGEPAGLVCHTGSGAEIAVSVATGAGLDALTRHLRDALGADPAGTDAFSARRRHLEALECADDELAAAEAELAADAGAELAAERLRGAQEALGRITGRVTTEDLLGEIFSRFCIGK